MELILGLVVGMLLGIAAGIGLAFHWNRQAGEASLINSSFKKEMLAEGIEGRLHNLKSKVEEIETRLNLVEEKALEDKGEGKPVNREEGAGNRESFPAAPEGREELLGFGNKRKERTNSSGGGKQERVLDLWQEGKEIEDIVKETGMGQGEVELILSLRNK